MHYSKQQKNRALQLYHQLGSITEVIRILGYPTRRQLYNWIYEETIRGANAPLICFGLYIFIY